MDHVAPLWKGRRFLPLWFSQALSALSENLFRFAFNAALIFGVIHASQKDANLLVSLSAAFFILPYLLISGISGQIADKYSKSQMLRWNRGAEIFVFGLAGFAMMVGHIPLLILCLILSGSLAAFYGPVKHAITPELVRGDQLIAANGAIESSTYAAILIGTLIGTTVVVTPGTGRIWTVILMLTTATIAWLCSLLTPNTRSASPTLKIDWNIPRQSWNLIKWGAEDDIRLKLLLGHGWFWFVGTAVLGQVTIFVKDNLHGVPELNTLLLALFAVGIGIGAWICNVLLRCQVSAQYASVSAFGMGFWTVALAIVAFCHPAPSGSHLSIAQFLTHWWAWAVLLSVVMTAVNGGVYVVPLVTMMQTSVEKDHRARMLSLANIWFGIFIVSSSLLSSAVIALGGDSKIIFLGAGLMTIALSIYIFRIQPKDTLRSIFTTICRVLYRVDVIGLENLEGLGPSAVIVSNHLSLIDGVLLASFLPNNPAFAIDPIAASRWYARPLVSLVDIFELNPLRPLNVRHLIKSVQAGRHCVIFPEGRLTETGTLMKIYPGPAMIAEKSQAPVVPVRIEGPQFTSFGHMRGILPVRLFPKVTIQILPAEQPSNTSHLSGAARRAAMTRNLYDVMTRMIISSQPCHQTLWHSLLHARKTYGCHSEVLEDANRNPLSYNRIISSAHALAEVVTPSNKPGDNVGILLPTGIGGVLTFFALQSRGRVPAMLNYSAGPAAIESALTAANIRVVITAREFIEKGKLENLLSKIDEFAQVIYLEDVRQQISLVDKIVASIKSKINYVDPVLQTTQPDDAAVVLFTSGSEGVPKGVALSHKNLLSNVEQVRTVIAYNPSDTVFNALPIFHAFGLTGGVLVPVLIGVKAFLHSTPLQYRVIPELVYHASATILFGTDTFLTGYGKAADCYDLYKVRMVFAGAERLRPETIKLFAEKFGVPIHEGYGVTECAPVIAVNTPMNHRHGTVGRFLPKIEHKLEPVTGIDNGAQLLVSGPNIMKGYYKLDMPGVLQPLDSKWYDTGDIVRLDDAGFVTIAGRLKRFAKIGGEMVSMASVEDAASKLWPGSQHAVVSVADSRKGEALVAFSTEKTASPAQLAEFMRELGRPEISIPKTLLVKTALPLLGTGKIDYVTLKNDVLNLASSR